MRFIVPATLHCADVLLSGTKEQSMAEYLESKQIDRSIKKINRVTLIYFSKYTDREFEKSNSHLSPPLPRRKLREGVGWGVVEFNNIYRCIS